MHPRIGPSSSEISYVTSAPRVTPTPPNVKFAEVLAAQAGGIARSAEAAMRSLPGAPIVALAIRGPGGVAGAPLLAPRGGSIPIGVGGAGAGSGTSAEGPGGSAPAGATAGAGGDAGIESSLTQSQEMNLYFLRIQEEMNAQNRTYSALSNVLKAEHDTVKNAISNIR
ncbi:MAG: hypothetical protein U0235_28675 [Polyangiaceae bacterium]